MSALDKFHDEAMEVAFFAEQERRRGNWERAAELFEQALDLELKALDEITEPVEPTYSILHRRCRVAGFGLQSATLGRAVS